MLTLIAFYWLWIIVAFLIGLGTAWWTWGQRKRRRPARRQSPDEVVAWDSAEPLEPEASTTAAQAPCDPDAAIDGAADASPPPAPAKKGKAGKTVKPAKTPETPVEPQSGAPDDLTRIKGVGPQLHALLLGLGISRFDQIASWSQQDIERVDASLGVFRGRITRDEWVEQARLLHADDLEAFRSRFGHS